VIESEVVEHHGVALAVVVVALAVVVVAAVVVVVEVELADELQAPAPSATAMSARGASRLIMESTVLRHLRSLRDPSARAESRDRTGATGRS